MSETQPDLREALARELARCGGWEDPGALWTDNVGQISRGAQGYPVWQEYADEAAALIRGPLAPILAQVSALQAEVERLQKVEGERDEALNAAAILLPFVDMAAGEGLEWSEQEDGSPRMDAADLCVHAAEALGFELGDERYAALLKQGQDAIRSARSTVTETKEGENA